MSFYCYYSPLPGVHITLLFNSLRIPLTSSLLSLLSPLTRVLNKTDSNSKPSATSSKMLQFQCFVSNLPTKTFWTNVLGKIHSYTIYNISLKSKTDSHIYFIHLDPDVYGELKMAKLSSVILSKIKSSKHVPYFSAHSVSIFFISGHTHHFIHNLMNRNYQDHFPLIFIALFSKFSELSQLSDAFLAIV